MGAITTAVITIAGLFLGWITIELACKPCLDKGREALDRSLDPNYDPDDDIDTSSTLQAPLNPSNSNATATTNPVDDLSDSVSAAAAVKSAAI